LACGQDVLPSLRVVPIVNILTDLILGEAIALLDFTFKLISFAVDGGKVVVGEITPFLLHLALHLLPVPFDTIPVHFDLRYENVLSKERSADRNVPVVARFKRAPITFPSPNGPAKLFLGSVAAAISGFPADIMQSRKKVFKFTFVFVLAASIGIQSCFQFWMDTSTFLLTPNKARPWLRSSSRSARCGTNDFDNDKTSPL
jgi:hypothetical protein